MPITVADLKFYQSQRMTDNPDGGGRMTAVEVVHGASNQIFDDLTDVERASGRLSIRKVFAAVASADSDKYLDAGLALIDFPTDPDTTVVAFSTGDAHDLRADLADAVGQYRARGVDTKLRLIGDHLVNQRVLYGYLLEPVAVDPLVYFFDAILSLAVESGGTIVTEQFVRVARVRAYPATYVYTNNNVQVSFPVREVVLDLATPLRLAFPGADENPSGAYVPPTLVRTTNVVAPLTFAGCTPLATSAAQGDRVLALTDTKTALVPVEYQDLGQNDLSYPAGTAAVVLTAPDGFSLAAVLPGPVNYLAYRYGDEWIGTGHPNAASYGGGTLAFPLRPDAASAVFARYVAAGGFVEESFSHSPSVQTTVAVTSLETPLVRGGVQIRCTIYPPSGGYDLELAWVNDNGNGAFAGADFIGTVNYATGALALTLIGAKANYFIAADSVRVRHATNAETTVWRELLPAPVLPDTVVVQARTVADGLLLEGADDGAGLIASTDDVIVGTVDYLTGLLQVTFAEAVVPNSATVSYRFGGLVPQNAQLLGIDPTRLPKDGRMPIFADGELALIHHTASLAPGALTAGATLDCGRTDLYRATIEDAAGQRLSPTLFTLNRAAGTLTLADPLDLSGYTGPYTVSHTIAGLHRVNRVSHAARTLTLTSGLARAFPAPGPLVSSVLYFGTLQARVSATFAQTTWTGVWADTRIGDAPLAQYNDALYPVAVTNRGAYSDRILIRFTSATAFNVIGERLGFIGVGTTNLNCAPFNALTGQPYFTLDYRGWGAGWATGNCLRFNLIGANAPVAVCRAVQPSPPTSLDDSVELLFLGNVDAD